MFLKSIWNRIIRWEAPPGVSVAMLALGAVLYSAIVEQPSFREKILWIAAFALFTVAEILAISRAQIRQNADYLEQIRQLNQIQQTADSKHEAIIRSILALNDPVDSLKKKAVQLSQSILEFVYGRFQHTPKRQQSLLGSSWLAPHLTSASPWQSGFWGQAFEETNQINQYQAETLGIYSKMFHKQVIQTKNEFAERGLIDDDLNSKLIAIKLPDDIRFIADRIGELADKLIVPKSKEPL
jgi:hypothetical protein